MKRSSPLPSAFDVDKSEFKTSTIRWRNRYLESTPCIIWTAPAHVNKIFLEPEAKSMTVPTALSSTSALTQKWFQIHILLDDGIHRISWQTCFTCVVFASSISVEHHPYYMSGIRLFFKNRFGIQHLGNLFIRNNTYRSNGRMPDINGILAGHWPCV